MAAEDVQASVVDPKAHELLVWAGKILYWILWPIGIGIYYVVFYICFALLFVVKLLYRPLEFIFLPVVYLVSFVGQCLMAPFRFLAKFEVSN